MPDPYALTERVFLQAARQMSVEQLAGQLLLIGLEETRTAVPLTTLSPEFAEQLRSLQPGGLILYGGSFQSLDQVNKLVAAAAEELSVAPFVGVDYEGGLVSRLTDTGGLPATVIPAARRIGVRYEQNQITVEMVEALGRVMGAELRAVGANMNFAPVADVDPMEGAGAIGRHGRTFSRDPQIVGEIAAALTRGLQEQGVAAVVKHFPGHGAVVDDSHERLPLLDAALEIIVERDLAAFESVFAANPEAIMTAHLSVPALDPTLTPATVSAPILTGVAREQFHYDGLIITDALNMRAMTEYAPEADLVVRAIDAGADMILKPVDPAGARDALVAAVAGGRLSRERLERSVVRVLRSKVRLGILRPFGSQPGGAMGVPEHRAVIDAILGERE